MVARLPVQALLAVFAGFTSLGGLTVTEFVVGMRIGVVGTLTSTTRGQEKGGTQP